MGWGAVFMATRDLVIISGCSLGLRCCSSGGAGTQCLMSCQRFALCLEGLPGRTCDGASAQPPRDTRLPAARSRDRRAGASCFTLLVFKGGGSEYSGAFRAFPCDVGGGR